MSRSIRDENFRREWDYHYLRSVHAAVSVAYERTAWRPADEAYVALADELDRRGVEANARSVYEAAGQISQGQQPSILSAGSGRHRSPGGAAEPEGPWGYTGRHVGPGALGDGHLHDGLVEGGQHSPPSSLR